MARFKIIVSDPGTGQSKPIELEGARAVPLIGRKLGDDIDGSVIGMSGHKLRITGGSDIDGFPMRPNIHGGTRTHVIVGKGVGFKPIQSGERRRKSLRGSVITEEIVQINMKIIKKPKKSKKKEKPEETVKPKKKEKPEETVKPKKKEKPEETVKPKKKEKLEGKPTEETAETA
jgi:small subunit ribosomal protein S6e